MMEFKPGEIVMVQFPYDDLTSSKVRPALVLAKSWYSAYLVAAITSQRKQIRHGAIEISTSDLKAGTMRLKSYILPNVLFTAKHSIIQTVVAEITRDAYLNAATKVCRLMIPQEA